MAGLFVTATGTGVGKTVTTALLLRQLAAAGRRGRAVKPVMSGYDPAQMAASDAGVLLAASDLPVTEQAIAEISPWRFAAPLSPDMAAAREARTIDFEALVAWCRGRQGNDPLLIEGVGGAMVPLDDRHVVRDWIAALDMPALLVGGSYLGAISHGLTALAALRERRVHVAAVIVAASADSPVPPEETAAVIARHGQVLTRVLPRLAIGADGVPARDGAPDLSDLMA